MRAIDRLKRDHRILRSKLDVIEAALSMGPETWYVLREVCWTLSRQLQNHMRREEELIAACRNAMRPKILAEVAVEHRDEPAHLQTIRTLFLKEQGHTLERLRPALTETIQGLRRHMAEEEAELFPLLERTLAARESADAVEPAGHPLNEGMTINRIVSEHPETRTVFERLFINPPLEGCACLDEIAWRHGMESEQLLAQLEQALLPSLPPGPRVTLGRLVWLRAAKQHLRGGCAG